MRHVGPQREACGPRAAPHGSRATRRRRLAARAGLRRRTRHAKRARPSHMRAPEGPPGRPGPIPKPASLRRPRRASGSAPYRSTRAMARARGRPGQRARVRHYEQWRQNNAAFALLLFYLSLSTAQRRALSLGPPWRCSTGACPARSTCLSTARARRAESTHAWYALGPPSARAFLRSRDRVRARARERCRCYGCDQRRPCERWVGVASGTRRSAALVRPRAVLRVPTHTCLRARCLWLTLPRRAHAPVDHHRCARNRRRGQVVARAEGDGQDLAAVAGVHLQAVRHERWRHHPQVHPRGQPGGKGARSRRACVPPRRTPPPARAAPSRRPRPRVARRSRVPAYRARRF